MNILHVIPSISHVHGGPSVAIETMTRALAKNGIRVDVATTDDDGAGFLNVPLGEPIERDNVTHWFFRRQTHFYKFSLALTRWLAQRVQTYDVVHIHALFSYAAMPAAFFAARCGVPYIVRPLGTLNRVGMEHYHRALKRISFPLVERPLIERAAFLHYTSELERMHARELGITQPSAVIPIGVEMETNENGARGEWLKQYAPHLGSRVIFLFLARLDPIKGLDVLLPAFARVRKQCEQVALVVAGNGNPAYENELCAECARLGIERDVFFAGYVEGKKKHALWGDTDVFVLPSRSENQGVAVVEAMAAGLPVIVTPEVGIANDVVASGAGVVTLGDIQLTTEAMLSLACDETRRREMGARGKKLAAQKFSLEAMTRALIELYETVIREARTR